MNGLRNGRSLSLMACVVVLCVWFSGMLVTQASEKDGATGHVLGLKDAVALALENHPNIISAKQVLARMESELRKALARRTPQFEVDLSHGWSVQNQVGGESKVTASLTQTLDGFLPGIALVSGAGGELGPVDQAELGVRGAELDLDKTKLSVTYETIKSYFGVIKQEQLVEVNKGTLRLSEEDLNSARAKLKAGTATKSDVLRAEIAYENAKMNLTRAQNQAGRLKSSFLSNLGLSSDSPVGFVDAYLSGEEAQSVLSRLPVPSDLEAQVATIGDTASFVRTALEIRPELKQAKINIEKAQSALNAARIGSMPKTGLSGNYRAGDYRFNTSVDLLTGDFSWSLAASGSLTGGGLPSPSQSWDVGISVKWQAFDGGFAREGILQAGLNLDQARRNYELLEQTITNEVFDAYQGLDEARLSIGSAFRNVEIAMENERLTRAQYEAGATVWSEVLDARELLFESEIKAIQAFYDYRIAMAGLYKAIGNLVESVNRL